MSRPRDELAEYDPAEYDLVGYVLGTLTPAEQMAVEAFLAGSPDARTELRGLQASLVLLTEALPAAEPRAEVWTALRAQLGAERPGTAPEAVAADPAVTVFRPRRWRGRDLNRSGWSLAACLGMVALGSLFWGFRSSSAYQRTAVEARLVAEFLAEPQVQKVTLRGPANEGLGGVLLEPQGRALFVLDEQPGRGRAYQAWGHTDDDWQPGGGEQLVSLAVSRDSVFTVPGGPFAALYLSLEPAGGSPQPTYPLSRVSRSATEPATPLEVVSPADGTALTAGTVIVRGTVAGGVTGLRYRLNGGGFTRTVAAGGGFVFTVTGLRAGANTLEVRASFGGREVAEIVTLTRRSAP